jgi:hypothetical protein
MSVVEFPGPRQQRLQAKFICSACGADRGCNCNAPAVEKLAQKQEQDRQRAREYRARKAKENQQQRHVTESAVDEAKVEAQVQTQVQATDDPAATAKARAALNAKLFDEVGLPTEKVDDERPVDMGTVIAVAASLARYIDQTTVEAAVKGVRDWGEPIDVDAIERVADFLLDVVDELTPTDPDDDGEPEEPDEEEPTDETPAAETFPDTTVVASGIGTVSAGLHTPVYDVRVDAYCGPTAASAITGLPISEIENAIRLASGKVHRADGSLWPVLGIRNEQLLVAMQSLGWSAVKQAPSDKRYRLYDFAREHGHSGPYIVELAKHYVAIGGGEFCDTSTCLPKNLVDGVLDRPGFGLKCKGRARVVSWFTFEPPPPKVEAAGTPSRADRAAVAAGSAVHVS